MKTVRLLAALLLLGCGVLATGIATVTAGDVLRDRHAVTWPGQILAVVHAASVSGTGRDVTLRNEAEQRLSRYTASGQPAWEGPGWSTVHQLRQACLAGSSQSVAANAEKALADDLRAPPQLSNAAGASTGQPLQAVYFNPAASSWIESHCLGSVSTLQRQLAEDLAHPASSPCPEGNLMLPPAGSPEITPCPPTLGSAAKPGDDPPGLLVAVKTVWQLITPLPPLPGASAPAAGLEGILHLKTGAMPTGAVMSFPGVYVDVSQPSDPDCHTVPAGAGHASLPIYSLNCFYTRALSPGATSDVNLPANVQSLMANGVCKQQTCYLVLVGMHVISNESPTWTWRTYWWDALKNETSWQAGTNGSMKLQGNKWSFFAANEALSDGGSAVHPNTTAIANPYIEGQLAGGMRSNCIGCHQYAAFSPTNHGTSLIACAGSFQKPPVSVAMQTAYFGQSLKTHFLWTLANLQPATHTSTNTDCPAGSAAALLHGGP